MADATLERPEDAGKTEDATVRFWLDELDLSDKREKEWRDTSDTVVSIYEAEKKDTHQFNILYSNTETLAPAVYNAVPRPAIRRRFHDKDPVGLLASKVANRIVEYHLDTNLEGYDGGFNEMMEQVIHEALLVGRGVPWLGIKDGYITQDSVPWDYYRQSYAKRSKDIWWIARKHDMTRDELVDNFGKIGKDVELAEEEDSGDNDDDDNKGSLKTACVWEIWDKRTKKVRFISPAYKKGHLRLVDDPFGLSGFFPCPQQLLWLRKIDGLVPVAPYELYEQQAEELNAITLRINRIIRVMKVRGAYDASVEGIDKIFELSDGQLAPVENVMVMQAGNGKLDSAIWLMPIEKLVAVLQQLYLQREQIKQVIFEITGLADVIRGSSKASETLGAQQIKEKWGGLRIRKMQAKVQLLARSIIRSIVELAVSNLPSETLYKMVQLPIPTQEMKAQAIMMVNMAAQSGKQPDPKALAVAQGPTFDDVLELLKDDLQRSFHVDIETNSTVDAEATEDMRLMNEFMVATGQFISGVSPLVVQGIMPFGAAQQILMNMSRRLRFGPEVEEQLEQMQAPKPQDDGKAEAQAAAQLEREKSAGELAIKQKELQLKEKELGVKTQELSLEKEKLLLESERTLLERERVALETLRVQQDAATSAQEIALKKEAMQGEWREKAEERNLRLVEGEANRSAQVKVSGAPEQFSGLQQQLESVSQVLESLQETIEAIAEGSMEVREMVSKPKPRKLDRGADGKVVAVDGFPVQRDADGRLLGWG